ncbi:MAG: low molecular weight phosphotyrosine protein phosphatase [Anaerolineae bacterium]|nr:MAG: low molecular weight phosphotyrosine protein phosphatase [Anaerolineae bacterium]
MIRVLFVCLGNICRSPMAEGVFAHLVNQADLATTIDVDSAGTSSWHVGEPPHPGTQRVLQQHGIALSSTARQVDQTDLQTADYIVAMDRENVRDLQRLDRHGRLNGKLHLLLDFAPAGGPRDVPDPYYDNNFDAVYRLVDGASRGLLAHIRRERGL